MTFELDDEDLEIVAEMTAQEAISQSSPVGDDDRMEEGFAEILGKLEELTTKTVNLAIKLEEHMTTPDAHNPGVMYKNKKSSG